MKFFSMIFSALFLIAIGCTAEQEPIHFGNEACSYCSMTIMDAAYASEIVTVKGKVYKYDSIECMIRGLKHRDDEIAKVLVMDFSNPGQFIDANTAIYLVSKDIASPMGANLSAFASDQALAQLEVGGVTYDWASIQQHVN